jgi:hypothetical protein
MSAIYGPTDVETKFKFSPHRDSTSVGTAVTDAAIIRRESGKDWTLSLCMMSLMYPQKTTGLVYHIVRKLLVAEVDGLIFQ